MSFSKPGTIECTYFEHQSNGYTCEVASLKTHRITAVNGKHLPNRTNDDVTFFTAKSKTLQFLPENLHKIFPNLEYIAIDSPEFNEIFKKDLEPFGKNLRTLALSNTRLEDLPADLFETNSLMGHLYVESKVFKHIYKRMFDAVPKLFYLGVKFPGYSTEAFNQRKIENAIKNLDIRVYVQDFQHKNLDRKKIIEEELGSSSATTPPSSHSGSPKNKREPEKSLEPTMPIKPNSSDASDDSNASDAEDEDETKDPRAPIVPTPSEGARSRFSGSPCGWIAAISSFIMACIGGLFGFLFMKKSNTKKD